MPALFPFWHDTPEQMQNPVNRFFKPAQSCIPGVFREACIPFPDPVHVISTPFNMFSCNTSRKYYQLPYN
jgi:hypothetical protein